MKLLAPLVPPAAACVLLISCDSFNKPLGGSDAYNPLDAPGGTVSTQAEDPYGPAFTPGTFLQTVSPSTAFFLNYPKEDDQPSKILPDYTDVKVISTKGSYVKVEVVDSGQVGYVPSVMLGEKRSPEEVPVNPSPTDVPLVPGEAPDPEVPPTVPPTAADAPGAPPVAPAPADAPPADPPAVAPEPEVPGNVPPRPVDPATPAE